MPTYIYKARDSVGKAVKGRMEALTREELAERLHKLGYLATEVVEAFPEVRFDSLFEGIQRISAESMVIFNVQLSNLLNAGIPLLASLGTMRDQAENKRLKKAVEEVSRSVEAGESFSEALARHPRIFSRLFVSMVRAGEASGKLDTVLTRLAVLTEQEADLKQKIRGALFYPAILLAAGLLVTLYMVTFLIPQFAEIFLKAGISLPLPTQILYQIGTGLQHYGLSLILFLVLCGVALVFYVGTARGRIQWDGLKLKGPLLGPLFRKAAISRFARSLGMLVESGVPILQSLGIIREIIGNEVLGRVIESVRAAVEKGEKISESLKISREFPSDVVQMIAVGEETGGLDQMLGKVADFYDRSIGYTVQKLTTVLEPLLLGILGCLVGFMMASMLLPIFDMMKILRQP